MMPIWLIYLIVGLVIFIIGYFTGIAAFLATKDVFKAGKIVINLTNDDKDIARFVFDKSLEDIAKHKFMLAEVKTNDNLKSFQEYQ